MFEDLGLRILAIIFVFFLCSYCSASSYDSKEFNVTFKLAELFELGKKEYENTQKEGEANPCWEKSMKYMIDGCKNLTEYVQMDIALRYSDCFVTSCGLPSHGCALCVGESRNRCIQSMSPEGYNAYTRFFISLQNICFFLESERWHNRTQNNVNNLVAVSSLLMQNLKESSKFKSSLLYSQRQTIYLQGKFRRNLSSLKHIFTKYETAWNHTVEKYVSVALKQEKLVLTVYDVFSVLNEWALNRYYWLGTVVFYIASVGIMYAFTVQPKARCARLPVVLVLSGNVLIEKLLFYCVFQRKLIKEADNLYVWIWMTRKIALVLCMFIIFTSGRSYTDKYLLSHKWITSVNNHLYALRVSLQKYSKKDERAPVTVLHIPIADDLQRSSIKVLPDSTFNIKQTEAARTNDVKKLSSTVTPDNSAPSLRRYNLRVRSTPPVEQPTVKAAL